MNVQLNHILSRRRAAELEHAGEQARLARQVRMRGRKLRHQIPITRLRARPARGLGPLIVPVMLAAVAEIDGRALAPGSYRLPATPTTDGIAEQQQQQTKFEIRR